MNHFILLLTALSAALIAGLFYGYSCSVNPGLGKLPDKEYLTAMQQINSAILNVWFFMSFIGTLVLLPIATWQQRAGGNINGYYLLLVATLIYAIGVFGVTMVGNVPLNDQLAKARLVGLAPEQLRDLRLQFEPRWVVYHQIRMAASVLTLLLAIVACLKTKPS